MGLKLGQRSRSLEKSKGFRGRWGKSVVACGVSSYWNLIVIAGSVVIILCSLVFFDIGSFRLKYSTPTLLHQSLDHWNLSFSGLRASQTAHILNGDALSKKFRGCNLNGTTESSHEYEGTAISGITDLSKQAPHEHQLDFDSSPQKSCREEETEEEEKVGQTSSQEAESSEVLQRLQEGQQNDESPSKVDNTSHKSEVSSKPSLASSQAQDDQSLSENSTSAIQELKTAELLKVSASTDAKPKESVIGSDGKVEKSQGVDAAIILPSTTDAASADHSTEVQSDPSSGQEDESAGRTRPRFSAACDISHGSWVYDESYPLYRAPNCPFMDPGFRCEQNGRPNLEYMKYRWQPHDCDLPRFNATDMLERIRGQRMAFVGDSLGRNHWESTLCMLAEAVANNSRIYEINGETISKHQGSLSFRFEDYNCTVEYYRSPFLIPQTHPPPGSPKHVSYALQVDTLTWSSVQWQNADILVFNAGHWWTEHKIFKQNCYFQVGDRLIMDMDLETGFKRALQTWGEWMDQYLDPEKTQVIFRSFAPVHFRGGAWNKGGHCHEETRPMTDEEVKAEMTSSLDKCNYL